MYFLTKYSIIVHKSFNLGVITVTGKNKVEVRIAGKDYTLVGTESDEYMQKVGLYVDKKMHEVMRLNNKLSTSMAAVLTALNIVDDFFKCHESEGVLRKELKKLQEELNRAKADKKHLAEENSTLSSRNTTLQLELAKREAELKEVRNSIDKMTKPGV